MKCPTCRCEIPKASREHHCPNSGEGPPVMSVPWVCTSKLKPEASATVDAQLWDQAMQLGAALLGVPRESVEAEQKR